MIAFSTANSPNPRERPRPDLRDARSQGGNAGAVLDEESRARSARDSFRASLRKLKFTRHGKVFVALTLGVGLAALNTGNNLLFLILGLMLATIIISGILAESSLRHVAVSRVTALDPVAREPFLCTYRIENKKKRGASFCLTVSDVGSPLERARASVLHIPAGSSRNASAETIAPYRGRFTLKSVRIATSFPFGFFEKSREMEVPGELFVLPGLRKIDADAENLIGREGMEPGGREGDGTELWQLRDLLPGDDQKRIHFRKSAAVGRYLIAEREAECAPRVIIAVNSVQSSEKIFEEDIENAAALIRLLDARGYETGIASGRAFISPASGPSHVDELMRFLACLQRDLNAPAPDARGETCFPIESLRGMTRMTAANSAAGVRGEEFLRTRQSA